MKRRSFIITAAAATAAVIATPVICNQLSAKKHYDPLIMPSILGSFCDEKTIREIGVAYRTQVPSENSKKNLTKEIMEVGFRIDSSKESDIKNLLDKKVQDEFLSQKMLLIKGWVLSATEARQCALFSLT